MRWLAFRSYVSLLHIGALMRWRGIQPVHELVLNAKADSYNRSRNIELDQLLKAVDLASIFYPRRVLCLQRSAVTVQLLRAYGFQAEMVIGIQTLPFASHAWVEIDHAVINDKPYVTELYRPIERC